MPVTITDGKYAIRSLSAAATTTVTIGTGTFVSGDFGATQRMVSLHSSTGAFKGIAWVRRFVSTTQLELENQFVDPATGLYATQVVGDQVLVSKNAVESAATGFAVDSVAMTITVTDNILMGTAGSQTSVCFYDQNYEFITLNGFTFNGGVSVFGKLMSYDGTGLESMIWSRECNIRPRSNYPGTGGTPAYNVWGTGGTSAHMFFFGGAIGNSLRDSWFIGAQTTNATNGSFCFYGTRLYYACASPSNGGNWSANASRHLLYKTIHEADYTNANLIVWGNGNFQGSFLSFPQSGAGNPIGVFRASSAVTFGASTNNRTIVNDLGTGSFIDDANNGSYTFINTITPAVSIARFSGGNVPIEFRFSDDYTNLQTNSTVAVQRGDGTLVSSVVNTASPTFTATVVQATYSATANGNATPTNFYTTFNYTVKCYGFRVVNGTHSTVTYPLGTAGNGTNLRLGGLVNQAVDETTTLTLAQALALSSKISGNSGTDTITVSGSSTLDEKYDYTVAWGCSSAALAQFPSLALYPVGASGSTSIERMKLVISNGATLSAGAKLKDMSGTKSVEITGTNSALTFNRGTVNWAPSTYPDQIRVQSGGTLNLTNGTLMTVTPTTGLGYGTAATAMFRSGSTLNMSDSTVVYNVATGGSGTFFSNSEGGATWNISNSTLTLNNVGGAQVAIHAYFLPASNINGLTVNGTATNVVWQMGFTSNNSKMVNFKYGGAIFGNGTSNVLMDTYTYTGSATTIPNTFGSSNKWWWVDPTMQAGGLFRWAAGSTPTGNSGFYGVIGFRPVIKTEKVGYAPKMRIVASALTSRYPTKVIQTTEEGTVALSEFFRDPTFMATSDGFLPFVDSLDSKTVINTIDWTLNFRQPGWIDQTQVLAASTARAGLVTYNASGAVDSNYVNASTAVADLALIAVDIGTKTIAPVSGTLAWSPQRLYNALKQWWATYASDTDFLAATANGILNLGDYNTAAGLSFVAGVSGDALTQVVTSGLINAPTNGISVTDSRGPSTIWQFKNVQVGSSLAVWDASGVTRYYQNQVTSAGDYTLYIPSGVTGTYYWAIEKYGTRREDGNFPANSGGDLFYVPLYVEDVGITQPTLATVLAYTEIETASKFYDRTAAFRLTEQGIKLGQMVTRAGTALEIGNFSHLINKDAASVYSVTGSVITTKSTAYAGDSRYTTEIAIPPATITANTVEVITIIIEDANGNSQLTINGGDGTFELWKVTTSTPTADYATGTLLATVGNGVYRFIGVTGFDIVGVDTNSNIRRRTSMAKGIYTQAFYVGDQIQLAQAPEVLEILTKVEIMQVSIDDLPQEIMGTTVETGATVVESLRLHNAVLGGKVSGGGTGVETFRDLADTKDRLVSTNDAQGNRTSEVTDLT